MYRVSTVCLTTLLALILVCSAQSATFTETSQPDIETPIPAEAYLRTWVGLGTFPTAEAGVDEPIPHDWMDDPISVPDLTSLSGSCVGRTWQPFSVGDGPKIDLNQQFGETSHAAAYAAAYIFADEPCRRTLLLGSDDGITVWLNGTRIFDKQMRRGCNCGEDSVEVYLREGRNLLVVKVTQGILGWSFCARFDTNDGLWVSTTPDRTSAVKLPDSRQILAKKPTFVIAPYIQNATTDGVTLKWQADVPSTAVISISDGVQTHESETRTARELGEVRISGLAPDTLYSYSITLVGADRQMGEKAADSTYTFRTFPINQRPVKFLVYGDTRTHPDRHARVIDAMNSEDDVDFVLHTGDVVGNGQEYALWEYEYFTPAQKMMRRVPFFVVLGNHENNAQYYFDYFALPMEERYYSFDILDIHVIGIDSCSPFDEGSEQYQWLLADLEEHKDAKWKFLFLHHPPYTSGGHGRLGDDGLPSEIGVRTAQRLLPELAESYGIQAVFAGHDHFYERSTRGGIHYIVAGGGGAPTYQKHSEDQNPYSKVFAPVLHYCAVTINGDTANIVVRDPSGNMIDEFTAVSGSAYRVSTSVL